MPDVQWYYARNDQPMGPVSIAELQQMAEAGDLKPDDLLWREGMDAWTTAVNLRGLFNPDAVQAEPLHSPLPRGGNRPLLRPKPRLSPEARLRVVDTTQIILWSTCVLVVLVGIVLFTRAFLAAEDATAEAAAGAVYAAFFVAAYVLARCGEKVSSLLLARGRRRSQ